MEFPDLSPFFSPASVAIVGASEEVIKLGGRPLSYMARYEYAGDVYPVHPKHQLVQGLTAYPSLSHIPGPVELAIIAVSAAQVEAVVQQGIDKGVKGFIVFSSGYAELNEAGRDAQEKLAAKCSAAGALLLGPNCMGCADTGSRLIASFSTAMETSSLKQGSFGLVTQSGALGSYWMAMVDRQGLGFSKFITTGNEAGVDLAQGIAYLADDQATEVIGVYVESIKDLPSFRAAALKAALAGKPVLLIKAGRSEVGAEATASHTGSLAGEDVNYQAFFDQFGIVRVNSLSEMIDTAKLLIRQPLPTGRRVGIVTISGGAGALLADELETRGLIASDFTEPSKTALTQVLPSYIHARNPLDHTAAVAADPQLFADVLQIIGQSEDHDAYIIFLGLLESLAEKLVATIKNTFAGSTKQVGVIWLGASPFVLQELEEAGIPVFADIPQAATAFAHAAFAKEQRTRVQSLVNREWPRQGIPAEGTQLDGTVLTEHLATQRVKSLCDIQFPKQRLLSDAKANEEMISELRLPLVAKLQSEAMLHRSEHNAVILNLQTVEQVQKALHTLFDLAKSLQIDCDGVLLQEMHDVSYELIVGIKDDSLFGPLLVIGRGGIDVELRPDIKISALPLNSGEIQSLLLELESSELFAGHRGRPKVDLDNLAQSIADLCQGYLADPKLVELEINPLAITASGEVVALDALGREI